MDGNVVYSIQVDPQIKEIYVQLKFCSKLFNKVGTVIQDTTKNM